RHGAARDHTQPRQPREGARQALRDSLAQVFQVGVVSRVLERENGERVHEAFRGGLRGGGPGRTGGELSKSKGQVARRLVPLLGTLFEAVAENRNRFRRNRSGGSRQRRRLVSE